MLQDLGAAFGPRKVDLDGWGTTGDLGRSREVPPDACAALPYSGATFSRHAVGEPGRQLLAQRLRQLSEAQIADLFAGARFDQKRGLFSDVAPGGRRGCAPSRPASGMISDGPPCPAL